MEMHKSIRVTPLDRREIWRLWQTGQWQVLAIARLYRVSGPTIYKVLERGRKKEFVPRKSESHRLKALKFGLKR